MAHKVYVSFKTEDMDYKDAIQDIDSIEYIDKSLNVPIESENPDYILSKIREDYLYDSTVTIFLIGTRSAENLGWDEQQFIKRELQGSLFNNSSHSRSGILGIVLPSMMDSVYRGNEICASCGSSHNIVAINDATAVSEFSYNYYIPNGRCSHSEDDRYCVLTDWTSFCGSPNSFIDLAYGKREDPISNKVKVRP